MSTVADLLKTTRVSTRNMSQPQTGKSIAMSLHSVSAAPRTLQLDVRKSKFADI